MSTRPPSHTPNERDSPDDATWVRVRQTLTELPVESVDLRSRVLAAIPDSTRAHIDRSDSKVTVGSRQRTVAGSNRLAGTVASLTAMLLLSFTLSGLMDEPSRHVRVAGSELMASIMKTAQDDWQVVVVTVPKASQATIRDKISSSALSKGMDVRSVESADKDTSNDHPDVFISSADSASSVLQLVDMVTGESARGINSSEIADMDRERLLSRFVDSMQHPTASEKFFGQMLIVERDSLQLNTQRIPTETGQRTGPTEKRKPVLVVLTSKDLGEYGPQGSLQQRERAIARLL